MLVYTMTPQESKMEWDNDNGCLFPKSDKKWYKKIGESIKHKTKFPVFFRHERIARRNNKRYMLVRFDSYSDYVNGRNIRVEYSIVPNPKGYRIYVKNYASNCLIIYSTHCIKRYIDRLGLKETGIEAIHKMMKDNLDAKNMVPFNLKDKLIYRATHGMFLGEYISDDIIIWTTFVNNERLFDDQVDDNETMEEYSIDFIKEIRSKYKYFNNNLRE